MAIHQVLMGAAEGDAITSMALNIQERIVENQESKIFAVFPEQSMLDRVHPIQRLDDEPRDSTLIYHSSYGLPDLTTRLSNWAGDLILCYHNVTPARYFEGIDAEFADGLRWGKTELSILRPRVIKAFADSTFNAQDLYSAGYRDVRVNPVGVDPQKLVCLPPDIRIWNFYHHLFPDGYIIAVSQILPHKRMEIAISTVHQLREVYGIDLGLVIVGVERSGQYSAALRKFAERLLGDQYRMTGRLNDRQLSTLFRHAKMYLGTSEHEGLSIPLIDSMALGVPAVVRDFGAIAETAGDGAIVLPANFGPTQIAQMIDTILRDDSARRDLVNRGWHQATKFEKSSLLSRFQSVLSGVEL